MLEVLVHADKDLLPEDLVHIEIEIPDDLAIERVGTSGLRRYRQKYPAPPLLRGLGAEWLDREETAGLNVPPR